MNNAIAVQEAFGSLRAEIVALFGTLWAKPEPCGLEAEALRHLSGFLEKHGLSVRRAVGDIPTAFAAAIRTGTGPRLGAWKTPREDPASFWNASWVE